MGMFDYVKIDPSFDIQLPKELLDLGLSVDDLEFQTKSLDNCMSTYTLKKDGLYKTWDFFDDEKNNKPSTTNINFHGILDFGAYHPTDFVDYLIDYDAKFTDGKLVDINLKRFQEIFHESKNKKIEEYKKIIKNNSFLYYFQDNVLAKILNLFFVCNSSSLGVFSFKKDIILNFYCPKFIIGYKKFLYADNFGVAIKNIDTELTFSLSSSYKEFCFKILGFGFKISKFGILDVYS